MINRIKKLIYAYKLKKAVKKARRLFKETGKKHIIAYTGKSFIVLNRNQVKTYNKSAKNNNLPTITWREINIDSAVYVIQK